ncbi:MAG: hypothetical protein WCE92_02440 [Nitrososphaeraceae archaeon]
MFATFFFQMWQRRPFSYTVRTVDPAKSSETSSGQQVLVVREQLFQTKAKFTCWLAIQGKDLERLCQQFDQIYLKIG